MAISPGITAFNAGELSPRLDGRWDFSKYASGCRTLLNFLPMAYGGVEKRPGMKYIGTAKFASKKCRLIRFQFSTIQAYVLEFGENYFRVYRDGGQVNKGDFSNAWITTTPYLVGDYVTESGSVYICRVGHTAGIFADDLQVSFWELKDWETAIQYQPGQWVIESSTWYFCLIDHLSGVFATDLAANNWVAQTIFEQYTPYQEADLFQIQFTQTADTLYITHKAYLPRVIERRAHDDWRFRKFLSSGGPFRSPNDQKSGVTVRPFYLGWIVGTVYEVGDCVDISGSSAAKFIDAVPATMGRENVYRKVKFNGRWKWRWHWDKRNFLTFIQSTGHGFKTGETVTVTGTVNYDGTYILKEGTDKNHLLIKANFIAETFTGIETVLPGTSAIYRSFFKHTSDAINNPTPPGNTTDWEATSNYTGRNIHLESSFPVFKALHQEALWQVNHVRVDNTQNGVFLAVGDESEPFEVFGEWKMVTNGTWGGTLQIQGSFDAGRSYVVIEEFVSNSNFNASAAGIEENRKAIYKIVMSAWAVGTVNWNFSVDDYFRRSVTRIHTVVSATEVIGEVLISPARLDPSLDWAEGAWSDERGYPSAAGFFEQRLVFAGTPGSPQTFNLSRINDFEEMSLGDLDDDAIQYTINADEVNVVRWLATHQQLLIGTSAAEWVLGSFSGDEPLTPSNISVRRQSTRGSKDIGALLVNDVVLFVHGESGRKIREFVLVDSLNKSGYKTPDMTRLAEHITQSGIVGMAYQSDPESVLWCWLTDGTLLSMAYERDEDVVAWSRHTTGASGSVESVAVIDGPGEEQEVWLSVKRIINGNVVRYVERFNQREWDRDGGQAFFVDSGLTFDGGPATAIVLATNTNPVVITANAHPFTNGQNVVIRDVVGMVELNDNVYTVANKTANTFELLGADGVNVISGMGVVAFWKMNDSESDTIVIDSQGTSTGIANFNTADRSAGGKLGKSLRAYDHGDSINLGHDPAILVVFGRMSWSMWIYLDDLRDELQMGNFTKDTVSGEVRGWTWYITWNEIHWRNHFQNEDILADISVSAGTWHHVVIVRDGVNSKIFMDNVELTLTTNTDTLSTPALTSSRDIFMMTIPDVNSTNTGAHAYGGRYDSVAQFDQALSAANVNTLWNSGVGNENFGFSKYVSGGTAQQVEDTFTNLLHLEGETCQVLADGGKHPDVTVVAGSVQLSFFANKVQIGLGYNADLQPMKLALSLDTGSMRANEKIIKKLLLVLYKTINLKVGPNVDELDDLIFDEIGTPMGDAPSLFSGDKEINFDGGFDADGNIYIRQADPFPATILALVPDFTQHGKV